MEPEFFDIDEQLDLYNDSQPAEKAPDNRTNLSKAIGWFTDPFLRQGYVAAAATNRGFVSISQHFDNIAGFVEESTGMKREGLFSDLAKTYEDGAEYWQKKAEEKGIGFIDELVGEAVGGFIPGVTQFSLDVASGLTFSYMDGAYTGYKKGENPFEEGILEAAKTGVLAGLFRMMEPLKTYLKAPTMGTVFGAEAALEAPEGQKVREFGKGFGTGVIYSASSPGGQLGLNEIARDLKPAIKEFQKKMSEERGSIDLKDKGKIETKAITPEDAEIKYNIKYDGRYEDFPGKPYAFTDKNGYSLTVKTLDELPNVLREMGNEIPISGGQTRQRKFLQTLEQSADIDPELKLRIEEIEPQNYFIKPNEESTASAKKMIEKSPDETVDFVMSDAPPTAEKGAAFHELIKKYQSERNYDKAIELIKEFDRQSRASGQFIQTAAQFSKMLSPEGFIRWANKELERTKEKYSWVDSVAGRKPEEFKLTREEEKIILEKYREMDSLGELDRADTTLELIDMVAKKVPPSISELIDAYRYQNMLSSPKTHLRNIGYNQESVFMVRPWDLTTRAAIDYVKSGLTGKERQAYINDVPLYLKTAVNSLPNAVMAFKESLKMVRGTDIGRPDIGIEAKTSFQEARTRQIPASLTMVQRFMEACDKFNMSLISAGEMAVNLKNGVPEAEAHARATKTSQDYLLRGDIDPKDPAYSIPSKALASLYKMMDYTRKLPVIGVASKWMVPFLRTPINLGIQMTEYSPLGFIRTATTPEASAKLLTGAIVTALGSVMAYTGETTWGPPNNQKDKELFYASGRKPYSVKMGDTWVPVWYLGPFALSFAFPMATKYYTQDAKSSMTSNSIDKLTETASGIAKFMGNQSSTQSIGALFSALDGDMDYKLTNQLGFTASQMIPGSSLIRYVNTIIDPVYRHPRGLIEGIESGLPILSKGLDARMKPFFEESTRDPINYFLPYDIGKSDDVYDALYRLNNIEIMDANGVKIDKLTDRMKNNPMNIDKSLEEYFKIISEGPDIKVKIGE